MGTAKSPRQARFACEADAPRQPQTQDEERRNATGEQPEQSRHPCHHLLLPDAGGLDGPTGLTGPGERCGQVLAGQGNLPGRRSRFVHLVGERCTGRLQGPTGAGEVGRQVVNPAAQPQAGQQGQSHGDVGEQLPAATGGRFGVPVSDHEDLCSRRLVPSLALLVAVSASGRHEGSGDPADARPRVEGLARVSLLLRCRR